MSRPERARKGPSYRGIPYWEQEEPVMALTEHMALAYYYPKAGELLAKVLGAWQ